MRGVYSLIALLLASVAHAQTIDVPKSVDVKTGRLASVVIKSDCKSIVYDLISDKAADIFREASDDGTIRLRVLPYEDGKFYLYVAGAVGDKVASAKCIITASAVPGPNPQPPIPNPPIPTPPTTRAVSLTFVIYQKDITASTAKVTEDADFRKWLKDNGVGVYGITSDADLAKNPFFKGITSPAIVLQDSTKAVIASDKNALASGDVAAAKAFVSKYLQATPIPSPPVPGVPSLSPISSPESYVQDLAAKLAEENQRLDRIKTELLKR